jgi:hypothetical protein
MIYGGNTISLRRKKIAKAESVERGSKKEVHSIGAGIVRYITLQTHKGTM